MKLVSEYYYPRPIGDGLIVLYGNCAPVIYRFADDDTCLMCPVIQ